MVAETKSGLLDTAATVYASAHDASAPDWKGVSVSLFSMFFKCFFCLEGFVAAFKLLFLHLCSLNNDCDCLIRSLHLDLEMLVEYSYMKCYWL